MTGLDVDAHVNTSSAYVHIPFCSAVCPYCDFAVVAGADHLADRYANAVVAEIGMSQPLSPLEAIFFGGGTPSHVDPSLLAKILKALSDRHGIAGDAEISLEANPEDFTDLRAVEIQAVGFNRVSFGAQSFDGLVLSALGRRHTGAEVGSSIEAARSSGFASISLDLIFGSPEETEESWARSIGLAIEAEPDHVSCYSLTVEPGTPLARWVREGAPAPDPDVQADRYEFADSRLSDAGYPRYEVSNWARPGHECRYNLTVWAQGEFEAYGNGAHRYRHGARSRNVRRLDAYLDRVEVGERPITGSDLIAGWDHEIDRLFVGLRRSAGVRRGPGVDAFLRSSHGMRLLEADVVQMADNRLTVIRPLLTDEVHRAVLDLAEPDN